MKNLILSLIFCFFAFNLYSQDVIPDDWKLSSRQAGKMMQYFNDCKVDCFTSKAKPDTAKENLIRAVFPNAKSITWENARYRNEDVARYTSRNLSAAARGGGQVGGYSTQIIKVLDGDDSVYYFDIVSICPPPDNCILIGD